MVTRRGYQERPIFTCGLFSAKENMPMYLFAEMFGGVIVGVVPHVMNRLILKKSLQRLLTGC